MSYPNNIDKFTSKLNKLDENTYVIEEVVNLADGVYEAELQHDNISLSSLSVYTGSKLTGNKIDTYTLSTPSITPWKKIIKIYSNITPLYITYETTGDTVEADDINRVQDSITNTQTALNAEKSRATGAESDLITNLNNEIDRASESETTLKNNLNSEITRAKDSESALTVNLNNEASRASSAENTLINNLNSEVTRAKAVENTLTNTVSSNKPNWDDKYTKNEIDNKISAVVTSLDYKEHVATYDDLATTYPNPEDGWTVSVDTDNITYKYNGSSWIPISANSIPLVSSTTDGKMSKQDKIDHDDMNSKKHTHSNKGILDIITQTLIDNWNAAYNHISDTVKHITAAERNLWNTVSNKVDKVTGKDLSTNDFSNDYKTKLDGISTGANKTNSSTTNGNIQVDGKDTIVYIHPGSGTNPHGTTKSDVGLSNVTDDAQVKRTEMGVTGGVATLDTNGINAQAPKVHVHVKSDITDFPLSMPANGGNADTIDNLHGSQFVRNDIPSVINIIPDGVGKILELRDNAASGSNESFGGLRVTSAPGTDYVIGKHTKNNNTYFEIRTHTGTILFTIDPVDGAIYKGTSQKLVTSEELSNAGYGDMLKSIYDTNNNGKVDKSEYADSAGNSNTVDGKHAADFVPNVTDISTTDLNDLLTTGFYQGCTVTNAPSNGWYYFVVIKYQGTGWCVQYATGFGSGSTNNAPNNIYMRVMRGGSWDGWTKVLTNKTGTTWNDLKGV
ncbi:pyocin knob domain-containing protein [Clostridium sp. AWRP]|uniref:pyocin knob domain-containing protein n=1 Tax=Clostridium sp. AWRP TaxID=2212991 RepID=UPI000FDC486E|nr:pyocin knob domain-containing protein [Clostridium sp. AWRP]AZV56806.1 hypothetical protein DMR38_09455 [Clostridium sp. AWRP]